MKKTISLPIAIIIIVLCAGLVGWIIVTYYLEMPEGEEKITEIKPPENKAAELLTLIQGWDNADRYKQEAIIEELANNREAALPVLRNILSNGTVSQKVLACIMLADMRDREAVDSLVKLAKGDDIMIAIYAINALRDIGDEKAAPQIRDILNIKDLDEGRKITALYALGHLGSEIDIDIIKNFLEDESESVQVAAASAMTMLGNKEIEDLLIKMTESETPFVSRTAVRGLGYLDSEESKTKLESIIENPTGLWKTDATIALEQQKLKKLDSFSKKIISLSELAVSSNKLVGEWAVEQIANIDSSEARDALQGLLLDKDLQWDVEERIRYLLKVRKFSS